MTKIFPFLIPIIYFWRETIESVPFPNPTLQLPRRITWYIVSIFQAHSAYRLVDGIRLDELNDGDSTEAREFFIFLSGI